MFLSITCYMIWKGTGFRKLILKEEKSSQIFLCMCAFILWNLFSWCFFFPSPSSGCFQQISQRNSCKFTYLWKSSKYIMKKWNILFFPDAFTPRVCFLTVLKNLSSSESRTLSNTRKLSNFKNIFTSFYIFWGITLFVSLTSFPATAGAACLYSFWPLHNLHRNSGVFI